MSKTQWTDNLVKISWKSYPKNASWILAPQQDNHILLAYVEKVKAWEGRGIAWEERNQESCQFGIHDMKKQPYQNWLSVGEIGGCGHIRWPTLDGSDYLEREWKFDMFLFCTQLVLNVCKVHTWASGNLKRAVSFHWFLRRPKITYVGLVSLCCFPLNLNYNKY